MRLPIAFIFSCICCLTAGALVAAPPTPANDPMPAYGAWHSARLGGGGYLQAINFCPSDPNRLYVIVDVSGPYRSDDGGQHWRMLQGGFPPSRGNYSARGLIVDPRNADKLIVANGTKWAPPEGIYTSDDGGSSWKKTLSATFINSDTRMDGQILARDPNNPDVILAASVGSGVYRSTDNGHTWTNVGLPGLEPSDVLFDIHHPNQVWLCAVAGKDFIDSKPQDFGGGFFQSKDGGLTWKKISDTGPRELHQSPAQTDKLYGIFDHKSIRVSNDGGATWADFSQGLLQATNPPTKGVDKKDVIYMAMAAGPDFLITASGFGTFYRRGLNDDHWQKIQCAGVDPGEWWGGQSHFGKALGYIAIDPHNPDHWFFTDWYAMWQTTDAGSHWKLTIDGIESTVIHNLTQDPSDPGVVHLGMGDNGYFASLDGGENFKHGVSGISNNIKDIALSPKLPTRLYAIGTKTYVYAANQIFVSDTRGQDWARSPMTGLPDMDSLRFNTIQVDAQNPYDVAVAVSGTIAPDQGGPYRSTDGGKTWQWIGAGLPNHGFFDASIWATGRQLAMGPDGAMVAISHTAGSVYRFSPADRVWKKSELPTTGAVPFSVVADPFQAGNFIVSITGQGLFRTGDSGATWKKVFDGPASYLSADQAKSGRFAASTGDGVFLSIDSGATWSALDRNLPERVLYNMSAFAGDRLVVGSNGSGVFWIPLSKAGEAQISAKPMIPAWATPADEKPPTFASAEQGAGADPPSGWKLDGAKSALRLTRDTQTVQDAPASLCLESIAGPTKGSAFQTVDATSKSFIVSGWVKAEGPAIDQSALLLHCTNAAGKSILSMKLADPVPGGDWQQFYKHIILPDDAAHVTLAMMLDGDGKLWLNNLRVDPAGAIYLPTPTPATEATPSMDGPRASADAMPQLINPDMTAGTDSPDGWKVTWNSSGHVALTRDTVDFKNAPASLCLASVGGTAYGTASQSLPPKLREFQINGYAKSTGAGVEEALIVVQGFDGMGKQVSFTTLAQVQKSTSWKSFSREVQLPDKAVRASLGVILKGDGKVWLDELSLLPAASN